jgi:hypothetical protein
VAISGKLLLIGVYSRSETKGTETKTKTTLSLKTNLKKLQKFDQNT